MLGVPDSRAQESSHKIKNLRRGGSGVSSKLRQILLRKRMTSVKRGRVRASTGKPTPRFKLGANAFFAPENPLEREAASLGGELLVHRSRQAAQLND